MYLLKQIVINLFIYILTYLLVGLAGTFVRPFVCSFFFFVCLFLRLFVFNLFN